MKQKTKTPAALKLANFILYQGYVVKRKAVKDTTDAGIYKGEKTIEMENAASEAEGLVSTVVKVGELTKKNELGIPEKHLPQIGSKVVIMPGASMSIIDFADGSKDYVYCLVESHDLLGVLNFS